jgi:uncharacterized repeat protein (TIGR01451 family)
VLVDPDFEGPITNTATISHPSLLDPVVVEAVAWVTDRPALRISKTARPDPVQLGGELAYTIRVLNMGQQATSLVVSDTIPAHSTSLEGSATAGGKLVGNSLRWEFPLLQPGEKRTLGFRVVVNSGKEVVNQVYAVTCAEGVTGVGAPLITRVVVLGGGRLYLPILYRDPGG